ncbi:MAG TPA: type II secretion system protein G [Thermoanaerobaculia bacterium]|nr:type II secretion system protein G [Thermoanaerobaculia bacterium]
MKSRAVLLIVLVAFACREKYDAARDAALKDNLFQMRKAIENYRADHGTYPPSLDALVPNYIRKIPADPITRETNWRVTTEESVQPSADFTTGTAAAASAVVVEVHSAAPGSDRDGVPYANY